MEILYLGHAGFWVRMGGKSIVFDPWLSQASESKTPRLVPPGIPAAAISRADVVVITHEHFDHCDAATVEPLVSRTLAHVVGPAEAIEGLDVPARLKMPVSEGENFSISGVDVSVFAAKHPQSAHPLSVRVQVGAESFFHAGDTYEFYELGNIQATVGALPIGGTFTMDALSAVTVLKRMRLNHVIPMHYDTFSQIRADTRDFEQRVAKSGKTVCHVLAPGESLHV